MRTSPSCLFLYLLAALASLAAPMPPEPWPDWGTGTVELVNGDTPKAIVVVAENPTRPAQVAARELIHYIHKMTGVELSLHVDTAVPRHSWSPRRILVGESELTRAYGLTHDDFAVQEYLVATRGQDLVLMGHDVQEFGLISYERNGLWPSAGKPQEVIYTPMGTLYAVHTFLERACGVRWYLPGELGEVCPPHRRLLITDLHLRTRPWTRYRMSSRPSMRKPEAFYNPFDPTPPDRVGERDMALWMLRLKIGGQPYDAGHAFNSYAKRFAAERPEWWKEGEPTRQWPHPDYVNPELLEQATADAKAHFAEGHEFFAVTPNDGRRGLIWSERGEALRREDPPDLPESFCVGWATDFVFTMANTIANEVRKDYPDRWISCAAYAPYFLPPSPQVGLAPNVAVCVCGHLHNSHTPEMWTYHADNLRAWSKLTEQLYIWEWYLEQAFADHQAFPVIYPHKVARAIKLLHEVGGDGMFFEASAAPSMSSPYSDATLANPTEDLLNHYVTWKLLTDADQDVETLLREFYRLYYGPAAKPMQQFYEAIEARWQDPAVWDAKVRSKHQRYWEVMYSDALGEQLGGYIRQARQMAATGLYAERVALADAAIYQLMLRRAAAYRNQFAPRARVCTGAALPAQPEALAVTASFDGMDVTLQATGPGTLEAADTVTFAVDPGRGRHRAFLYEVDLAGNVAVSQYVRDKARSPGDQEATVTVTPGAPWRVELTLSLLPFGSPPEPGDVWGLAAIRRTANERETWPGLVREDLDPDSYGVLIVDNPGCTDPPTPVLHLDFENWQTEGIVDRSGNGSKVSARYLDGGTRWSDENLTDGYRGAGLRLHGESAKQFLEVSLAPHINLEQDDFTLGFWYRSTSPGGLFAGSTTSSPFWQFYLRDVGGEAPGLCVTLNADSPDLGTSLVLSKAQPALGDSQWHHIAMVVDRGRNVRLYLDGRLVEHKDLSNQRGALKHTLTLAGPHNYLQGDLDEVMLVPGALDADQLHHTFQIDRQERP